MPPITSLTRLSPAACLGTVLPFRKPFVLRSHRHETNHSPPVYQVFSWYVAHDLPATPVNPGTPTITALSREHKTVPSLSDLPKPRETAVSIITPPAVTQELLEEAKKLGIPAVWLQPGTFDDSVIEFARADGAFEAVVAGDGGRGSEGWCVLVDGERALKAAGKL